MCVGQVWLYAADWPAWVVVLLQTDELVSADDRFVVETIERWVNKAAVRGEQAERHARTGSPAIRRARN